MSDSILASLQEADIYIDYKSFLSDDFDPNVFANATINDSTDGDGDVATALAKLTFNVESLNRQIHEQVITHYEDLLKQVSGIRELEVVLATVKINIGNLNDSLERFRQKLSIPYSQIKSYTLQLQRLQTAAEIIRRLIRFLHLSRRLEAQLPLANDGATISDGRELAKAALTLSDLETIIEESDLDGIDIVELELPIILKSRTRITEEANRVMEQGMKSQNQADIASSLQVFYNLKQMGNRVQAVVEEILEGLLIDIKYVIDMNSIHKELKDSQPPHSATSLRRTNLEPTPVSQPLWAAALWSRMERLISGMGENCIRIYVLERVLERKRDPITKIAFVEEVVKTMDGNMVHYFWKQLSVNLEQELKEATQGSAFLQNTFITGYPKLLRLFHEFFSRVSTHSGSNTDYTQSPEYALMQRSISSFEAAYLARSLTRIFEPINAAFPNARSPPNRNDVANIVRVMGSELDTAKFDHALLRAASKNVVKALKTYCDKCERMIATDSSVYQLQAPSATVSQIQNSEIINSLYFMYLSIWKVLEEMPEGVVEAVKEGAEGCRKLCMGIVEILLTYIRKNVEGTILKMHREDFARQPSRNYMGQQEAASSQYMIELSNRIRYIQTELLARLSIGQELKTWVKQLCQRILHYFVFQASLIRPLGEPGKLKLTNDITQLEFSISQLMNEHGMKLEEVGEEHKTLRAFRQLLFLDTAQLTAAHHIKHIPIIILLHFLIVRSSAPATTLPLPHKACNTTEAEYATWVDEHTPEEAIEFLFKAVQRGSKVGEVDRAEVLEWRLMKEVAGVE